MKAALTVAVPLIILGTWAAACWYAAFRVRTLLGIERPWPLRVGLLAASLVSLVGMLVAAGSESALVGALNLVAGYAFSWLLFGFLFLLLLHAIEQKVTLPGRVSVLSAVGGALLITFVGALWAGPFSVRETTIPLPDLSREVTLLHISDVHLGHHRGRDFLEQLVTRANELQPDLVLLNGDLVDSNVALHAEVLEPLSELEAPAYFVNGNHDNYVETERAFELIAATGVRILHNEVVDIHGISLIGLDYMNPDDETFDLHPSADKRTIQTVLPTLDIPADKPAVLMHHSPAGAQYMAAAGVDLLVSGHTHAGQIFPATLITPFLFPFNRGLYDEGDLKVFVSVGAGTFATRMRLGTSNEINLLRLTPAGGSHD